MDTTTPALGRLLIFGGLSLAFLTAAMLIGPSLTRAEETTVPSATGAAAIAESTIDLGRLQSNQYIVRILGTPNGVRYTVLTTDHEVVAENLSASEVASQFEDLPLDDLDFSEGRTLMWVDPDSIP